MYRKYKITKTNVINPHHYLLQTEDLATAQPFLFHQILLSSQSLPTFHEQSSIDRIISQSENQNSINEIKSKYQFYLEQNLLQIRMRKDIMHLNNIGQYQIGKILELINTLNLDFVISVKQIRSNMKSNFHQSNANKFFSCIVWKDSGVQSVIPFVEDKKIHYYDIFYADKFGKNKQKEKKVEQKIVKSRLNSAKKLKKKSESTFQQLFNSDQCIFQRYINLIVALYSSQNIAEFYQQLSSICLGNYSKQSLKKIDKFKNSTNQKLQIEFFDLLKKCLTANSQYNTNIFIKQCEVLLAKYDKIQKSNVISSQKNIQKLQSHLQNNEKIHNSRSFQVTGKQIKQYNKSDKRQIGSQKRLKSSKSLINLKWAASNTTTKGRSLKTTNSLFSKSKEKLIDKTNLFQQTWGSVIRQKPKINFNNTKSSTFSKLIASSSNWFNESLNQNQSMVKLRNFKKSNHLGNSTPNNFHNDNLSVTSHIRKSSSNIPVIEQSQIIDESQLGRFSRLIQKQGSKKNSHKEIERNVQIQKNDVETMTQQNRYEEQRQRLLQKQRQSERQRLLKAQQMSNNSAIRREIVNTINFKYYEEFQPKIKQDGREKQKQIERLKEKLKEKEEKQKQKQKRQKEERQKQKIQKEQKEKRQKIQKEQKDKRQKILKEQRQKDKRQKEQRQRQRQKKLRQKERQIQIQKEKERQKVIIQKQKLSQSITKSQNMEKLTKSEMSKSVFEQKQSSKKNSSQLSNPSMLKKKQAIKPSIDDTEIEEVSFAKAQPQSPIKKQKKTQKQLQQNDSLRQQKKSQNNLKKSKFFQQQPPKQKISQSIILPQQQKKIYISHYGLFLKFYQDNMKKVNCLPQLKNISYIVNFLYLKTLLQHIYQKRQNLLPLIGLLVKKQQKITQEQRNDCHLYKVSFESLIQKSKSLKQLEKILQYGGQLVLLKSKIAEIKQMIEQFYLLTCESNKLLQLVFNHISSFMQNNKVLLIQQKILTQCLYMAYFLSVTLILSLQRQKYYKNILEGDIKELGKIFTLTFKASGDEYINKYKQTIQFKELTTISIKQQCTNLKNWYQQYL